MSKGPWLRQLGCSPMRINSWCSVAQVRELVLRKALLLSGANWEVSYWDDLSVEEVRSRLAKLPKDTIVLFVSIERDGTGRPYISRDLIPGFSAASSAPIYSMSDGHVGFGIVGGSVLSFEAQGKQAAEIGERILLD